MSDAVGSLRCERVSAFAADLQNGWRRYSELFGEVPHGTDKQLGAMTELLGGRKEAYIHAVDLIEALTWCEQEIGAFYAASERGEIKSTISVGQFLRLESVRDLLLKVTPACPTCEGTKRVKYRTVEGVCPDCGGNP